MKRSLVHPVLVSGLLYLLSCTKAPVVHNGGGSEVEVVGYVFYSATQPAPSTQVKLIPADYNPATMPVIADSMIDTTDAEGRYAFTMVTPGLYNVQAVQLTERSRMLVTGVDVKDDTTIVPDDSLRQPGAVRLLMADGSLAVAAVTIPGTDITATVSGGSSDIVLDSVPAGLIPEIRYVNEDNTPELTLKDILVTPSDTTTLANPGWTENREILLNTTPTGADITSDVYNFPVLIRLSSANFDFSRARADGADLLFTRGNRPLSYELELWDPNAGIAAVWVAIDTIFGNDSTQSITMYWGNAAATAKSNGKIVFDTTSGFAGVWHLGDASGASVKDATVNGFDGTSPDSARPAVAAGIIGSCRKFDGTTDYISMPNTASSSLNFPEYKDFTISAWVYADTLDHVFRTIVTKGYEQYFLQLSYFPGDSALWQFSVFTEEDNWNMSHVAATRQKWVLLTGVRHDSTQSLYVNGTLVADLSVSYFQDTSRNTSNDLSIGRFMQEANFPTKFGFCYFKGNIDEVRISSVARDADWIRLDYMNQRSDDKLLKFK